MLGGVVFTATQLAISIVALASVEQAESPVNVPDTQVFPESISVTWDGTLLIAGSEKGFIYKAAPGTTAARTWIPHEARAR